AERAVLVPTAEEDPLIRVGPLAEFFARPAGYLFLTPEEAELVPANPRGPSAVIGAGIDPVVPPRGPAGHPAADLTRLGVEDPFVLYLGRVDPNKGCETLLRYFARYVERGRRIQLVLAGPPNMPLPAHPLIRPLGFVEPGIREALLSRARVLMMPSPYESL